MKNWIVLNTFLWIVLFPIFSIGQNNQWLEYQNKTWLQIDSNQITTANLTHATLEGCIDLVEVYRTAKTYTDSLIPAYKAEIGSLRNQLVLHEEKDAVQEDNTKFLEKSLKKEKFKKNFYKWGGVVIITASGVFMLYTAIK